MFRGLEDGDQWLAEGDNEPLFASPPQPPRKSRATQAVIDTMNAHDADQVTMDIAGVLAGEDADEESDGEDSNGGLNNNDGPFPDDFAPNDAEVGASK